MFTFNVVTESGENKNTTLDVLWTLIDSYQVDIFEVRLSKITADFLKIMKEQHLSIEEQADFTAMLSKLIYYKSRQMLPNVKQAKENDKEDKLPLELVEQLLEYKRFQIMANELEKIHLNNCSQMSRNPSWNLYEENIKNLQIDFISFLRTYRDFLLKEDKKETLKIEEENINSDDVLKKLLKAIKLNKSLSFFDWISGHSVFYIIVNFILILELARTKIIKLNQSSQSGDIQIISYEFN